MKKLIMLALSVCVSLSAPTAFADTSFRLAQGYQSQAEAKEAKYLSRTSPRSLRPSDESFATWPADSGLVFSAGAPLFDIFDAWVTVAGDLDFDGYFHHVSVGFDADINLATRAAVYAKIYLSRDHGPWLHFVSTDLFEIHADDVSDSYEIYSELVEGFEPGYYRVLIELHSLYHPGIVSERLVDLDASGHLIALEDMTYDEPYVATSIVATSHHDYSGAFNAAAVGLLFTLLLIKVLRNTTTQGGRVPKRGGVNAR